MNYLIVAKSLQKGEEKKTNPDPKDVITSSSFKQYNFKYNFFLTQPF